MAFVLKVKFFIQLGSTSLLLIFIRVVVNIVCFFAIIITWVLRFMIHNFELEIEVGYFTDLPHLIYSHIQAISLNVL